LCAAVNNLEKPSHTHRERPIHADVNCAPPADETGLASVVD
jgi:hypothetical protein